LSCKHQGFTFLAKETNISDKNKKVKKGGPVSTGLMPGLTTDQFIFFIFFITDLSYVGCVPLGGFVDMLGNWC
jgi:hypothetical protein